jgi:hypothetical protein
MIPHSAHGGVVGEVVMHFLATGAAFLSGLASSGGAAASDIPCPPQPMPPAIESAGTLPVASDIISFAATPTEYPGRAWVVRLSRRGADAKLEIVVLRRQFSCNRYDVERRWEVAIGTEDYRSVAQAIAPWAVPPSDTFSTNDRTRGRDEITLDGTPIELRVVAPGWQVTRTLNHYGRSGAELSAIFRSLLAGHVPESERPAEDWRTSREP